MKSNSYASSFVEFEFDLPGALLTQLVDVFAAMKAASLSESEAKKIPDAQGVYQLFLDGKLSYIGKTDAEAGLRQRLTRHAEKIQHRIGLDPGRVSFCAIRVLVFTVADLESQLIKHYATDTWNGSGFGSNDPGRERDTTTYKSDHFDALYPIDIDRPLRGLELPTVATAAEIFKLLRQHIPYTFRAQNIGGSSRKPHADLNGLVLIPDGIVLSTRGVIGAIVRQLPAGWQAVKLPSHVILYKDDKFYPAGEVLAHS